ASSRKALRRPSASRPCTSQGMSSLTATPSPPRAVRSTPARPTKKRGEIVKEAMHTARRTDHHGGPGPPGPDGTKARSGPAACQPRLARPPADLVGHGPDTLGQRVGVDAHEHIRPVPEHVGHRSELTDVSGAPDHVRGCRVPQTVRGEPREARLLDD